MNIPQEEAEKIKKWMKKGRNFLIYLGNPGIGKTYFCKAMINDQKEKSTFNSMRFWNEGDLFNRIRSSFGNGWDYLQNLQFFCDDELLIIDDLGSTGVNDWRAEVLFHLINFRYESTKPTVFTSNFTKNEIFEKFGKRIGSRIFAEQNTIIQLFDHVDLRTQGL